ncbi:MAG TPA: carboxypeptidase regulatory-like domain-containing protein [Ohtaekwangia sp.]|uniref:carboxypeptidase regulatory-like domain-containing protein n=1 Tax=Ohtaekwangia sp. TaxID=2066019 RepID=UPI002F93F132
MRKLLLLTTLVSLLFSAQAQKQGVRGQVFWVSGNQMPGPDQQVKTPQQGIVREIYIYNATRLQDATQQNGFFSNISTTLVAKVISDKDGSFKVKLPEGKYSVFVKEDQGLFANLYDGNGCINCVSVKPRKYSWITITVDYQAAY